MPRLWVGLLSSLAVASLLASAAFAAPAQVIIIRHAEKPDTGPDLNDRGYQRADALVGFFENDPAATRYGTPAAIYAMAPKGDGGSLRAIETVTPLAKNLGLKVDADYKKDQLSQVVRDIMGNPKYAGKMVLVCWEHKVIPSLAQAFGWTSAPDSWAGAVFDRAWVLDFAGDKVTAFRDVPEHVLPGDSSK